MDDSVEQMKDIADIIRQRSTPGILIFDQNSVLLFCNGEASELVNINPTLKEELKDLCNRAKSSLNVVPRGNGIHLAASGKSGDPFICARAFMVGGVEEGAQKHVIVLLEKVTERRNVDLQVAKRKFKLSKRELEVVALISEGLSNKVISDRLFISIQTVKDHIRHIMRKVEVTSRAALIAALQ